MKLVRDSRTLKGKAIASLKIAMMTFNSYDDDGRIFLDPAVGTGTYLVAATNHALDIVRQRSGEGAVGGRASQIAANMYGFEILVGPYAVVHLRLAQVIEGANGTLPDGRLKVYLADTLESPYTTPSGGLSLTHKRLTEEHEAARRIKRSGDILVCLGNPPYDRQNIEEGDIATKKKGGWVRYGDLGQDVTEETKKEKPIFDAFLEPARQSGAGLHLKNVYNDYVYFWRWALWRLFEQQKRGGIVTFITASSYLAGPGFVGVREVMRRTFDELWIINLGGDNLGPRKTENVFAIQNPVSIAIGFRGPTAHKERPAAVRYTKIEGTRAEKLAALNIVSAFTDLTWLDCPVRWHAPFLPQGRGAYFDWPALNELFPYRRSGSKFGRSWPIAETASVLEARWNKFRNAKKDARSILFRNNKFRKIEKQYLDHRTGLKLPVLVSVSKTEPLPKVVGYSFRHLDRHFAFEDNRFNDRMGAVLWLLQGPAQLYINTLMSCPLGVGPSISITGDVPDLHHFRGSFGGKDVFPLWGDSAGTEPNITAGLLSILESCG